jgi:putative transposase
MKKRHTEEQIAHALRQAEGGLPVAEICRNLGISDRQENRQLKSIVADLTLDKQILQESLRNKL